MWRRILLTLKNYDWWLVGFVFLLLIIGIVIIYSIGINSEVPDNSRFYKQVIFAVIGIILMFFISFFDYRILNNYSLIFFSSGIILLISVLFFGSNIRGTSGWFVIGPVSFQPIEICKIFFVAFLARFFSQKSFAMDKVKNIALSGFITAIYVILGILQPDLGSVFIFIFIWLGFILLSNIKKSQLLILFLLLVFIAINGWFFALQDYQKERIITFINPSSDSLKTGYNVIQSTIAIGSGKIFGRGLGLGPQSQLNFLPEQEADFIFAVIAEELGFIGSMLIISLFGLIFYRTWRLTKRSQDDFTLYLTNGILIILFGQTVINIGMNVGLMPVTGLTLPWVSAGGSSLATNFILIGILESVYKRQNLT